MRNIVQDSFTRFCLVISGAVIGLLIAVIAYDHLFIPVLAGEIPSRIRSAIRSAGSMTHPFSVFLPTAIAGLVCVRLRISAARVIEFGIIGCLFGFLHNILDPLGPTTLGPVIACFIGTFLGGWFQLAAES